MLIAQKLVPLHPNWDGMSIIRREKSRIGLYHALQQGADNNDLFLDEEDYQVFVDYLKKLMKEAWL